MKVAKIQFEIHFNFILGMYFLLVVVLNKKKDKNFLISPLKKCNYLCIPECFPGLLKSVQEVITYFPLQLIL